MKELFEISSKVLEHLRKDPRTFYLVLVSCVVDGIAQRGGIYTMAKNEKEAVERAVNAVREKLPQAKDIQVIESQKI